jgi:hypothetical protein
VGVLIATPVGSGSYRLTEDAESFGMGQFTSNSSRDISHRNIPR